MGEFRFVESLNPQLFHIYEKNSMEAFSTLDVYKSILDLDELKSVYAAYNMRSGNITIYTKMAVEVVEFCSLMLY